ncbi:MAG: mitochondrial fission ELM1 family protein [Amphiplicatus sp.]
MTPKPSSEPLYCWVVSDGRAGMENQALGLAEAIARRTPLRIETKRIAVDAPWRALPRALWGDPFARLSPGGARLDAPFPDLWIACGRISVPFSIAVRKRSARTFVVQTQAPRAPLASFDLVVPPEHDGLEGPNVFPILGAPNRLAPSLIEEHARRLASALAHLPAPRVAVLVGGPNRAYRFSARTRERFADGLRALAGGGAGLMITTSRRTEDETRAAILAALKDAPHFFWKGEAVAGLDNPYFGMLGLADHVIVTADSVNMATEAAITGKPVHVFALDRAPLARRANKFERFHRALAERGASRPFSGALESWRYEPLDETSRAADETIRRLRMAGVLEE